MNRKFYSLAVAALSCVGIGGVMAGGGSLTNWNSPQTVISTAESGQTTSIKHAQVAMSDWNFDTQVEIDGLYYYLDTTNKLAEFMGLYGSSSITSLVIPETVSYEGTEYTVVAMINRWQSWQDNISSVTLPATLQSIGDYAFWYYRNLTYIEIPASVTNIGYEAFGGADNLHSIKLNSTTPPVCNGNMGGSSQKKVLIPDGCYHDYRIAAGWNNHIIIPETPIAVTVNVSTAGDLGRLVLEEAGYLQEVNKLTVTGELNADDWTSLQSMTNLIEVDLNGVLNTEIPELQFSDGWAIEKVVLPSKLTKIGRYAFRYSGIKEILFPETLSSIDREAFSNCYFLTKVLFSNFISYISDYAFEHCSSLTEVSLPNSITSMGSCAFNECYNLVKANIPEGLSVLPSYTFSNCDLHEITIPSSLKTIGRYAFQNNSNLRVNFSEGLDAIEYCAFNNCNALDTLELPSTLRTIQSSAFLDCKGLKKVTLSSSLRECSGSPFSGCDNLKEIYANAVIPAVTNGNCPLSGVDLTDVVLYVPAWSLQAYLLASGWNEFFTVEATDYMPQDIVVNRDFTFALGEVAADYRPNIEMLWTDYKSNDSYGHYNYERGNLTITSRGKLAVNNFSMYLSPLAKYFADENVYRGYDYDNWQTSYNPTSLIVNGEMRAENVTINMMAYGNHWQFISFPFDVNVSDIVPVDSTTQWVIREYSGYNRANNKLDSTWVNLKADDMLQAGKGYILHCYNGNSDVVDFTVTPVKESVNRQAIFTATDRTVALEENIGEFEHNRSWNLIGNPYPSFYDSRFLDFDAPITVWNSYTNSYMAFSPVDDSYILNPGEAFFVQRPVDQEGITFAAAGRQTHRYARILEESEAKPRRIMSTTPRTVYNITLSSGEKTDRTRVVFNEQATTGYELNRDASKFMSDDAAMPQIYTVNGNVRYAINERPKGSAVVELGLHIGSNGTHTIALANDVQGTVVVEDRLTGTFTTITTTEGYNFEAEAGDIEGRFFLHFGKSGDMTGISDINVAGENAAAPAYNTAGQRVNADTYKGIVIKNGRKAVKK